MGYKHDEWAIRVPVECMAQRVVLMILNYHAQDDTGICWPGVDTVAAESGADEKTVSKALARLVELGLIVKAKRPRSNANQYRLRYEVVPPKLGEPKNGSTQNRDDPKTVGQSPQKRMDGTPKNGGTVPPNLGGEPTNNTTKERRKERGSTAEEPPPTPPPSTPARSSSPSSFVSSRKPARRTAEPPAGTPCPFALGDPAPEQYVAIATAAGLTANVPQIFAKFVSHHLSHGSVLADWPAGWNGWCLDELRFASTRRMRQGRAYIEGTTDADYLPNSNELTDEARRRIGWGYDKWGKKPK